MTQNRPKAPQMTGYINLCTTPQVTQKCWLTAHTARMKTDSVAVQAAPFSGRKQSLIEDARRERSSGSAGSPGPSRYGDGFVFEEKDGRVTVNVLFTLSNEKNAGFFKTGKIFEVSLSFF